MRLPLIKYGNIADDNNNPPSAVSFMTDISLALVFLIHDKQISSTSGRLHSEFIRLLFLQDHRETDRFFVVSGVQFPQTDRGHKSP